MLRANSFTLVRNGGYARTNKKTHITQDNHSTAHPALSIIRYTPKLKDTMHSLRVLQQWVAPTPDTSPGLSLVVSSACQSSSTRVEQRDVLAAWLQLHSLPHTLPHGTLVATVAAPTVTSPCLVASSRHSRKSCWSSTPSQGAGDCHRNPQHLHSQL